MPNIDFSSIASAIGQINPATPSWDLFILLFFVIGALVYGFTLGRERVIVMIVAIYMALAVVTHAPYIREFRANIAFGDFAFQITMFLGVFVLLFFFLSRSALMRSLSVGDYGKWWQIILFSFLHTGLLISLTLSYLPIDVTGHLLPVTQQIFTSEIGRFVWIVLPIVGMMLMKGDPDDWN